MKSYHRISLTYLAAGVLWILLSDRALDLVTPDAISRMQTYKGWFFVTTTTLLLYGALRRRELRLQRTLDELAAAQAHSRETVQFVASTSHELRTPLSAILGFSSFLLQEKPGPLNQEQREQLGYLRDSARHLQGVTGDITDLARLDDGRVSPVIDEFPLDALLDEAAANVRELAAGKGLTLSVVGAPGLVLRQDRRRLLQCVLNLLSNAVKFTDAGEVALRAAVAGPTLRLEIRDTGSGIRPEARELLFRPYSRLDTPETQRAHGTGLGLFITRRLVEGLLGGQVGLEAADRPGSVFFIEIPIRHPGSSDAVRGR
jgi:signal transduction histidine kinase